MSYIYDLGHLQRDNSRWVVETITDGAGIQHQRRYRLHPGVDPDTVATEREARLLAQLPDREASEVLLVDVMPVLKYQTAAQLLQRIRELYRSATREDCVRIARWILHRLDAGHVTVAQLRTAFGLTTQQWNTLETKMRNLISAGDAVETAAGE